MTHHTPAAPGTHPNEMPIRHTSTASTLSDDAIPIGDPKDTTELLAQRLTAWKFAVDHLVNYVETTEKMEKAHSKECEKILKTVSSPLKHGEHFDQGYGGITGMFESMRANTQALVTSHQETEKNLKHSILPILERLHKEIKSKTKELSSGATKGAKAVEKARAETQKHIELLGQHSATYESAAGKNNAMHDPYVIARGVQYRLSQQVTEENTNRHEIITVQNNFAIFEGHIIEVIQQAMASFNQLIAAQAQKTQTHHADMLGTTQKVTPNFEWERFVQRNGNMLIDPTSPDRSLDSLTFPNQDHKSTQPLIAGTLERKSRNKLSMGGYSAHYYAITPSKYLHEYKSHDNIQKDPQPEMSIYLPDAVIGATNGDKFHVKGKDVSKGLTSKLSGSSEISFKAHSAMDASKWFEVIRQVAGTSPTEPYTSAPSSPVGGNHPEPQLTGVTGDEKVAPVQPGMTTTSTPATTLPAGQPAAPAPALQSGSANTAAPSGLAGDKL